MKVASSTWLGAPLVTLKGTDFSIACADLMRLVELDYSPDAIIGIRTGGLTVATAMGIVARSPAPVLPLTSRRVTTATKSHLPLLRSVLGNLPRPVVDALRRIEHRFVTAGRLQPGRQQRVDEAEVAAIAAHLATLRKPARLLVVDDAVDSGTTLASVLRVLSEIFPAGGEIRSAAITQTLKSPLVIPDYVLFRGTLCRFPWSFDAAA